MIWRAVAGMAVLWMLGFAVFATTLPSPAGARHTDAIVVLTGGPGRVQRGLEMLGAGTAQRMLISGVDRRVRPIDLAQVQHIPPALLDRVDLGREAIDTRSNADETAAWLTRHHYRSLRLVTTDWHMRRARFELKRTLAGVDVLPDAVPSEPNLPSLLREYDKYLLRRIAALVGQ
jgi:uncharacterized SAM-binding protein YcdF (DUF218 family)